MLEVESTEPPQFAPVSLILSANELTHFHGYSPLRLIHKKINIFYQALHWTFKEPLWESMHIHSSVSLRYSYPRTLDQSSFLYLKYYLPSLIKFSNSTYLFHSQFSNSSELQTTLSSMAILKRKINWRNFWICFSISLGQVAFGYPSSIIGTTLGQPAFLVYMGLITPEGILTENANNLIGATSGVFQMRNLQTKP